MAPQATYGPVTLSLGKISYCTTLNTRSHMQWIHLPNRDGMFAVFDTIRRSENDAVVERRVLKLVHGGSQLEQIDLDAVKYQSHVDVERAKSQVVSDQDLLVLVIVKKPLLAMRYQLPDGQTRRVQMNFQPVSGYDVAVSAIKAIGLPIRVKEIPHEARIPSVGPLNGPAVTSGASRQVSQEQHGAVNTLTRPTSRSSQAKLPDSSTIPSASPYPWLSTRPPAFDRDGNPEYVPTSGQHQPQSSSPIKHIVRPSTTLAPGPNGGSNLSLPNAEPNYSTSFMSIDNLSTNNLSTSVISHHQETPANPMSSSDIFGIQSARVAGPSSQVHWTSGSSQQPSASKRSQVNLRPTSAPEVQTPRILSESLSLSQMLPPPRVLPFPEEKRQPPKRKSEEAMLSQEPAPSAGDTIAKPKPKRKSRAKTALAKATTTVFEKPKTPPRIPAPKRIAKKPISAATKKCSEKIPSASAPVKRSKMPAKEPRPKSLSPFDEEATTVASSPIGDDVPRNGIVSVVNDNAGRAPQKSRAEQKNPPKDNPFISRIQPQEFMASLDTWIRRYHDLPAPEAPKTSKDLLAAYAAQNDEERSQSIDNLICECLEDENFGKLVEDIEGAWKRITLGF